MGISSLYNETAVLNSPDTPEYHIALMSIIFISILVFKVMQPEYNKEVFEYFIKSLFR